MTQPGTPGGRLLLRPGGPLPHNLHSSRPQWAARLGRGRPAAVLPGLLASLFNLCGPVHRLCATLAVAAATGQSVPPTLAERQALQRQTLREHLQRMLLDWPHQLGGASAEEAQAAAALLAGCPLWAAADSAQSEANRSANALWLADRVFGQPLEGWLASWDADAAAALQAWLAAPPTAVARWLAATRHIADFHVPGVPALRPHGDTRSLRTLAAQLAGDESLRARPLWQGTCAETGPWARLAEPAPQRLDTPLLRLGARLAETARLALPDDGARRGADGLSLGALALAGGEAIAWVEMARGLLLHWVLLAPPAAGDAARVLDCAVIAPTEWNFHPAGAVAGSLAALPPEAGNPAGGRPSALGLLLAAYDPCMPCEIRPWTTTLPEARDA